MTQLDWNTLSVMATIFSVGGMSAFWIESRFRRVEKIIYEEIERHRKSTDSTNADHARRIQRLELKEFGFTKNP